MSSSHAKPNHHAETAPMHDAVDSWHDHSHDQKPQAAHGEVQNSNLVMFVGILLTGVIVGATLVVYGFYTHFNTQRSAEREHMARVGMFSELALSHAEKNRAEKSKDLGLLSKGGVIQMPTETENVSKPVTISKIDDVIDGVVQMYTSGRPAK